MQLPSEPLRWSGTHPAALWVSPDQWLLVDESRSVRQLIGYCDRGLGEILHNATDSSDALTCITVGGAGARGLLAMLSGVDFDAGRFAAGQCVRTRMAKVAVLVRAMIDGQFELFVDRSVGPYLETVAASRGARSQPPAFPRIVLTSSTEQDSPARIQTGEILVALSRNRYFQYRMGRQQPAETDLSGWASEVGVRRTQPSHGTRSRRRRG